MSNPLNQYLKPAFIQFSLLLENIFNYFLNSFLYIIKNIKNNNTLEKQLSNITILVLGLSILNSNIGIYAKYAE